MNLVPLSIIPHLNSLYLNHFTNNPEEEMEPSHGRLPSDPAGDSELDAEGEEVDEEYDETIIPPHNKKKPKARVSPSADEPSTRNTEAEDEEESNESDATATDTSTDTEDNEWEGSDAEEETDAKTVDSNLCMYVFPN
jgi:hypothetical protein